jgi:hypothetical protein
MRHRRRLDRLRDRATTARTEKARAVRARVCVGLEIERVLELVEAAVRPEHGPILDAICRQAEDYEARGYRPPDGSVPVHGFLEWVWGLQDGWWSLPEELPEDWLLAWRNGYAPYRFHDKTPWCPRTSQRCEDCRLGLPCTGPDGRAGADGWFRACPACGGTRLSVNCLFDMRKFSFDGGKTTFF